MLALTQQLLCLRVLFPSPVTKRTFEAGIALEAEGCKALWCKERSDECVMDPSAVCFVAVIGVEKKKKSSRQGNKVHPFCPFYTSMGKTVILQLSRRWSSSHKITGNPSHSCVIVNLCLNHKEYLLVCLLKKRTHIYIYKVCQWKPAVYELWWFLQG